MATITSSNNRPAQPAGQSQQQNVNTQQMSHAGSSDPFMALGLSGDQSRAGTWAQTAFDALSANGSAGVYRVGTIPGANASIATVGYISFEYKNTPIYALVVFETRHDSIITGVDNGKPYYLTVNDMITPEFLTDTAKVIQSDQKYTATPYFVQLHIVQQTTPLNAEKCLSITSHLLASIQARGDNDGAFDFQNASGIAYSFATNDEGAIIDRNGQTQRADWTLGINARPAKTATYSKPTITEGAGTTAVAPVDVVGFVNMRYVGPKEDPRVAVNPAAWDPAQIDAELTITGIDAVSAGYKHMLERSLIALAGVTDIARQGGWVAPLLVSLKEKNRKLAPLCDHLIWATEMDTASADAGPESKKTTLKLICNKTASVNMIHRNGDSLGGLSALLSEIAMGNTASLATLTSKLDSMFHIDGRETFTTRLCKAFNVTSLTGQHIVATAIPVIAGTYQSANGTRSIEDVDLVYVANRFADNPDAVRNYVMASSYDHRSMDPEAVRLYLMEQATQLLGGGSVKFSGNALNMVLNPTFLDALSNELRSRAELQMSGVEEFSMEQSSLFQGGRSYTVSGMGGPGVNSSFGTSSYNSGFKY